MLFVEAHRVFIQSLLFEIVLLVIVIYVVSVAIIPAKLVNPERMV